MIVIIIKVNIQRYCNSKYKMVTLSTISLRTWILFNTWPPVVLGMTEREAISTYVCVVINKSTQTWNYHETINTRIDKYWP